jgi:hypothetical protein
MSATPTTTSPGLGRRRESSSPARTARRLGERRPEPVLGRYRDAEGAERRIVARPGIAGSVLVLDEHAARLGERRLVAHLAPDEPADNARIVAAAYLTDPGQRWARAVRESDWLTLPGGREPPADDEPLAPDELVDARGRRYRLAVVVHPQRGAELRWTRRGRGRPAEPAGLRAVIGALEAYQPARRRTEDAINAPEPEAPAAWLAEELRKLDRSPLVLNRALREAVKRALAHGELTMSEIAARCGHGKSHARGLRVGDTSWLGRRIGTLPETGRSEPTPWIRSDVLALIARRGLGIEPREVELA